MKKSNKKSNRSNITRNDSPNQSGSDIDRSSRSRSRSNSGSEKEEDTPPQGEKSKDQRRRSNKNRYHKGDRVVAAHSNRRIGGKANPTPPLQIKIFRKASDKKPQNEKLETAIGDTGCTTSCIPLKMAKMHNLKVEKVNQDDPDMKSYQGSGMEVVGQTKFFLQIQTRKGFTRKKMLHCLVVDKTYDHEILIS